MIKKGLVSILMNCLNGEKYIAEAIDSVLKQTYQNWEIIFWDNNSIDKTSEIVKSYTDPRIRYFKGDHTVPLYAARNLAIAKVEGEFIACLDVDDLWMSTKLEKQIPLFNDTKISLVYSDTYFFNETGIIYQYYKHKKFYTGKCFERLLDSYFLSLETVVVRTEKVLAQPYYFDERFNMCGDYDLFCRIGYSGELAMINEPLGMWRVDRKSLSWTQTDKFFKETELMLERYSELYPNFNERFKSEISTVYQNLEIGRVKVCLREGKNQQAKKMIRPYLFSWDKRPVILYALSSLPSSLTMSWCSKRF